MKLSVVPKVSIIIPTYNYAHFITEAIQSVLSQTFQDFEVIVVDDGSTDNTREVLAQFGNKIRYIYQENRGLSAARNTGILNSSGQYLCFLDSDDSLLPEKLELQVKLLDSKVDVDLVYTWWYLVDENGNIGIDSDCFPASGEYRTFFGNLFQENSIKFLSEPMNYPERFVEGTADGVSNYIETGCRQLEGNHVMDFSRPGRVYRTDDRVHYGNMETDFSDSRIRAEYYFPPRNIADAYYVCKISGIKTCAIEVMSRLKSSIKKNLRKIIR